MAGPGCPGPAGEGRTLPWATQPHLPACCLRAEGAREALWASPGHGKVLLPWVGLPPIWTVGGVLTAIQHPLGAQHRVVLPTSEGARGPEAPPRIT